MSTKTLTTAQATAITNAEPPRWERTDALNGRLHVWGTRSSTEAVLVRLGLAEMVEVKNEEGETTSRALCLTFLGEWARGYMDAEGVETVSLSQLAAVASDPEHIRAAKEAEEERAPKAAEEETPAPALLATLWSYRNHNGHVWGPYSDDEFRHTDGSAERYCRGIVDSIGEGEVIRIDRFDSDYATTGRNWRDVLTVVHALGRFAEVAKETPAPAAPTVEELVSLLEPLTAEQRREVSERARQEYRRGTLDGAPFLGDAVKFLTGSVKGGGYLQVGTGRVVDVKTERGGVTGSVLFRSYVIQEDGDEGERVTIDSGRVRPVDFLTAAHPCEATVEAVLSHLEPTPAESVRADCLGSGMVVLFGSAQPRTVEAVELTHDETDGTPVARVTFAPIAEERWTTGTYERAAFMAVTPETMPAPVDVLPGERAYLTHRVIPAPVTRQTPYGVDVAKDEHATLADALTAATKEARPDRPASVFCDAITIGRTTIAEVSADGEVTWVNDYANPARRHLVPTVPAPKVDDMRDVAARLRKH